MRDYPLNNAPTTRVLTSIDAVDISIMLNEYPDQILNRGWTKRGYHAALAERKRKISEVLTELHKIVERRSAERTRRPTLELCEVVQLTREANAELGRWCEDHDKRYRRKRRNSA